MGYESGELRTMQSGKEIDLNTTLPAMIDFRNALRQAKTGFLNDDIEHQKKASDNERKINQVRGLSLLISSQETLITLAMSQINYRSEQKFLKDYKEDIEKNKHKFIEKDVSLSDMKYDINKLRYWKNFLQCCRKEILNAERTKDTKDDFIIETSLDGDVSIRLTDNFWNMLEDLQESYSAIHLLLLVNKVISSGVEQDEELTYKEQEQLFISRVKDA